MLETLPDETIYWAGVAIVTLLVAGRVYVGEQYFRDRGWFWSPIRRLAVPLLHRLFQRHDEDLYAETRLSDAEYVGTLERDWRDVRNDLLEQGYYYNPLASFATTPDGTHEVASLAWYHGPKPWPGAPEFLRPRQVHVRLVDRSSPVGPRTAVYAHEEATSWRPDRWRDHYTAASMDVEVGVAFAAYDLGLADRLEDVATDDVETAARPASQTR